MIILDILIFLIGIILILLVFFVYFHRRESIVNQSFAMLSLFCGIWSLTMFFYGYPYFIDSLNWLRIVYLIVHLLIMSFFLFAYVFPYISKSYKRVIKIISAFHLLLLPVTFYFLWFTRLFVVEVSEDEGQVIAQMGPVYLFYGIYWCLIVLLLGPLLLYKKYHGSRGRARYQLQTIGWASIITAIPIFFVDVFLPIAFGNTNFYNRSPIFVAIFIGAIAYTIIKHRFLGIGFILGKFLYYVFAAAIPLVFFYLVFGLQLKVWSSIFVPEALITSILGAYIYILFYGKLEKIVRRFFEKSLIYAEYDPVEVLETLENIIRAGQDLDKVVIRVCSFIKDSLGCRKLGLILYEKDKGKTLYENLIGFDSKIGKNISKFRDVNKLLVYDEITAQISEKGSEKLKNLRKILDLMKKEEIAILLPLDPKAQFQGVMLVGYRKNQEVYTVQDINLLENIASKLSEVVEKFIITTEDVNQALKNFSSPHLLKSSNLLRLKQAQKLSEEKSVSKVDALKDIIASSIEYFKPENDKKRRTMARLKYEILRMIAYEGATESQIMWDLGFDVYTRSVEEKISEGAKPRFPLKSAGEYSATSDRSFKRLKKEAVEMLKWKVEEGEKIED